MSGSESPARPRLVAGRYQLVAELGRGGMGVVWRATDQLIGRTVALKELRPPLGLGEADREEHRLRALAEARSAARINHPAAVTLHDVLPAGADDEAIYLVMELIDGPTLAQLISPGRPLPAPAVAGYGLQLLSVLETAHQLGVVHRDVKPANIMIAASGQVKLTDFGIAHILGDPRLTVSGVMGTQAYLAPELFESEPVTPAADLWSLGATLYAAAAGYGPFERDSSGATMRAILLDDVPAPACAPALAAAIASLLQRDPARRSVSQARSLLQQALGQPDPVQQPPPLRPPRPEPSIGWQLTAATQWPAPVAAAPQPGPPALTAEPADGGREEAGAAADVTAVVFSPDGRVLAVADNLGKLLLCDARTGRLTRVLSRGSAGLAIESAVFSPDGQLLITAGAGGASQVWDVASQTLARELASPAQEPVNDLAFSPAQPLLAAAGERGTICLWDPGSGQLQQTLSQPGAAEVLSVAFRPDGTVLAGGCSDGSLCLWQLPAFTAFPTAAFGHQAEIFSVAFPDEAVLAAASDDGRITVWDIANGTPICVLDKRQTSDTTPLAIAANPADRMQLAAGYSFGGAAVWDLAKGRVMTVIGADEPPVLAIAYAPDGRQLATGHSGGRTRIWDISAHKPAGIDISG